MSFLLFWSCPKAIYRIRKFIFYHFSLFCYHKNIFRKHFHVGGRLNATGKEQRDDWFLVFSVCNKYGNMMAADAGFYWQVSFRNCLVKTRDMNLTLQPILQTRTSAALTSSTILHEGYFLFLFSSIGTKSALKAK